MAQALIIIIFNVNLWMYMNPIYSNATDCLNSIEIIAEFYRHKGARVLNDDICYPYVPPPPEEEERI